MPRTVPLVLALAITCGTLLLSPGPPRMAAQVATPNADCPDTTEDENQAIVQRYYDAVSAFDLDALDAVLAPVVVQHAADVEDGVGAEQVKTTIGLFLVAFPNLRHEIEQWVTDGDFVAARVIQSGTHEGEFLGIPATGRDAVWTVIGIWRIECSRIAEHWVEVDQLSRLQQLGAFPTLGQPAGTPPRGSIAEAVAATPAAACPTTTEEQNAALVHRWYDEVWTQGNVADLDELIAPDHIHHRALNQVTTGAEARERSIRQWHAGLS
ncbi:MAG TPA: ester cyclase family protein [Thermomicrobiales bacterium]|nr:ester cyclase family protein [Thermomicrobiales bacterium]